MDDVSTKRERIFVEPSLDLMLDEARCQEFWEAVKQFDDDAFERFLEKHPDMFELGREMYFDYDENTFEIESHRDYLVKAFFQFDSVRRYGGRKATLSTRRARLLMRKFDLVGFLFIFDFDFKFECLVKVIEATSITECLVARQCFRDYENILCGKVDSAFVDHLVNGLFSANDYRIIPLAMGLLVHDVYGPLRKLFTEYYEETVDRHFRCGTGRIAFYRTRGFLLEFLPIARNIEIILLLARPAMVPRLLVHQDKSNCSRPRTWINVDILKRLWQFLYDVERPYSESEEDD